MKAPTLTPQLTQEAEVSLFSNELLKDDGFDEIFIFNHVLKKQRKFELTKTNREEFPFLLDNEFMLNGTFTLNSI